MTAPITNSRTVHDVYAEGSRYFMGEGKLHGALGELCSDLDRRGIDYMVIGAVALMAYGYPRFTEDIDLVMTAEGLDTFHRELVGLGDTPAFPGARKRLRATKSNVPVEIIVAGEYPGDGKPKPISFPVPAEASVEIDGVRVVALEKLVELKLASGMTAPDRLKDLADVQELIKARALDASFADRLHPYVRERFLGLLRAVEDGARRGDEEGGEKDRAGQNQDRG
ncbi:MAG: nucleotidyltransferase [Acidobacteria bacterium]|nr:nucleotidyltransferase [Acidobacteriota bacterium]MCA1643241.1 nucleotidyltransferase [Acidobacteriota bacterium]